MIQIEQPELEALILERFQSGRFKDVEEVILQALKTSSDSPAGSPPQAPTGAEIVASFQRFPLKDLDIDFDSHRSPMPVRLFTFED